MKKIKLFAAMLSLVLVVPEMLSCGNLYATEEHFKEVIEDEKLIETVNPDLDVVIEEDYDIVVYEEPSEETTEKSTEETTEETTEDSTEEKSSESDSEESPSEKEEPSTEQESDYPEYTVEDANEIMYVQKPAVVRDGPSTDFGKIGELNPNDEVHVTGRASTGWYRIDYNGYIGFTSNTNLGTQKIENTPPVEQPTESEEPVLEEGAFLSKSLLDKINNHRAENGSPMVSWSAEKEAEALERATQLFKHSTISHDGMPEDSVAEVCFRTGAAEDTVAINAAWSAYMNSENHRNAIANPYATSCVVATYKHKDELFSSGYQYFNVILFY